MIGGDGRDLLFGDRGDDVLFGDADNDTLDGGNGRDALFGGSENDTLEGRAGVDRLMGGQGRDQMTGGAGHDRFIWNALDEGGDKVHHFASGQDLLLFDAAVFGGLVAVDETNFVANDAGAAQDADDTFIFSTGTKGLFFDADGNGAQAKILIAHFVFQDPAATLHGVRLLPCLRHPTTGSDAARPDGPPWGQRPARPCCPS